MLFADLIAITSFDFFEPTEHIDFNITETEPHNPKFEQLGYSSKNILENTGSLIIFIMLLLLQMFLMFFTNILSPRVKCCRQGLGCCPKLCRSYLKRNCGKSLSIQKYVNKVIRFLIETFMALLICGTISLAFAKEVPKESRSLFD